MSISFVLAILALVIAIVNAVSGKDRGRTSGVSDDFARAAVEDITELPSTHTHPL